MSFHNSNVINPAEYGQWKDTNSQTNSYTNSQRTLSNSALSDDKSPSTESGQKRLPHKKRTLDDISNSFSHLNPEEQARNIEETHRHKKRALDVAHKDEGQPKQTHQQHAQPFPLSVIYAQDIFQTHLENAMKLAAHQFHARERVKKTSRQAFTTTSTTTSSTNTELSVQTTNVTAFSTLSSQLPTTQQSDDHPTKNQPNMCENVEVPAPKSSQSQSQSQSYLLVESPTISEQISSRTQKSQSHQLQSQELIRKLEALQNVNYCVNIKIASPAHSPTQSSAQPASSGSSAQSSCQSSAESSPNLSPQIPSSKSRDRSEEQKKTQSQVQSLVVQKQEQPSQPQVQQVQVQNFHADSDVTTDTRVILIDWLIEVSRAYQISNQSLFLAVNYLDRILELLPVKKSTLQLFGVTCFMIAAKFEEVYPPLLDDYVELTANSYTKEEIIRAESQILEALDFKLTVSTVKDFLNSILLAEGISDPKFIAHNNFIAEMSLVDINLQNCLPYALAVGILGYSKACFSFPSWFSAKLEIVSPRATTLAIFSALYQLHVRSNKDSLCAAREKYSDRLFFSVADIPPPTLPENMLL